MTPFEMAQICVKRIQGAQEMGLSMKEIHVQLTITGAWKKPAGFPRGRLNIVHPDGRRVWSFKAVNVLAWLAGNGLVKVDYLPAKGGTNIQITEIKPK